MSERTTIRLTRIIKNGKGIEFQHECSDDLKKYIKNSLFCQYNVGISNVPDSIVCIPFIANVLPIVWLTDSIIYVEELDKSFYECVNEVREGYKEMYPMLQFNGDVIVNRIVDNSASIAEGNESLQLFSGGVDAYTTFFRHLEKKPDLITVWGGGDVNLNDKKGWRNVSAHTKKVAKEYGVKSYFIRSNFVEVLNVSGLDELVSLSGDQWWHGFQHALALLGLSAPLAFKYKKLYIASSYPAYLKGKYTLASDPTIDNHIRYADCKVEHDGYELDRQDKVRILVNEKKSKGHNVTLRVCWESDGGNNCCRCEKCYRTILEIVSEGGDPNEFGFKWGRKDIKKCRWDFRNKIITSDDNILFLRGITEHLRKQKELGFIGDEYNWFFDIDFDRFNKYTTKKIYHCLPFKGVRKMLRLVGLLAEGGI